MRKNQTTTDIEYIFLRQHETDQKSKEKIGGYYTTESHLSNLHNKNVFKKVQNWFSYVHYESDQFFLICDK